MKGGNWRKGPRRTASQLTIQMLDGGKPRGAFVAETDSFIVIASENSRLHVPKNQIRMIEESKSHGEFTFSDEKSK